MHQAIIHEVEQFLYREARLLDERRFHEWLELLTDDIYLLDAGADYPVPRGAPGHRHPRPERAAGQKRQHLLVARARTGRGGVTPLLLDA
jgi:Ring hydroxylating beta subunit